MSPCLPICLSSFPSLHPVAAMCLQPSSPSREHPELSHESCLPLLAPSAQPPAPGRCFNVKHLEIQQKKIYIRIQNRNNIKFSTSCNKHMHSEFLWWPMIMLYWSFLQYMSIMFPIFVVENGSFATQGLTIYTTSLSIFQSTVIQPLPPHPISFSWKKYRNPQLGILDSEILFLTLPNKILIYTS